MITEVKGVKQRSHWLSSSRTEARRPEVWAEGEKRKLEKRTLWEELGKKAYRKRRQWGAAQ